MASLVQNPAPANGTGTSIAKAFSSNVTAGNTLVAFATTDPNTTHTFSSPGDTWQTIGPFFESGAGQTISIGVCFNATGGAKTVTCTFGATGIFLGIIIAEFSNTPAYTALDVKTTGQHVANGNPVTDASMVTTANGDLVVSLTIMDSTGVTVTAGTGFTLLTQDTTDLMSAEFQTQSSAGSIAPTFNVSANANAGIISAAFLAGGPTASQGKVSTNRHPGKGPGKARFFQTPRAIQSGNTVNIDGSLTVTANRTATVAVTHTIGGSLVVTATRTATVAVTHTIGGSRPETVNRTATVAVTHVISGTRPVTVGLSASMAVTHTIGGSRPETVNRTATAAVTHTIGGSLVVTVNRLASVGINIDGSRPETVNRTATVAVTHTVAGSRPIAVTLTATMDVPSNNQSLFLPFF